MHTVGIPYTATRSITALGHGCTLLPLQEWAAANGVPLTIKDPRANTTSYYRLDEDPVGVPTNILQVFRCSPSDSFVTWAGMTVHHSHRPCPSLETTRICFACLTVIGQPAKQG